MAQQQHYFDVKSVAGDGASSPGQRTPRPVFNGVGMYDELFGRQLIAGSTTREHSQGLPAVADSDPGLAVAAMLGGNIEQARIWVGEVLGRLATPTLAMQC
jgi:hypothetical protein